MSEDKLEFKRPFLIYGNLALVAWIFLSFGALVLYNQLYGWLFLMFTSASVYLILRRLGCSSCYYCKTCTSGFGRLAGAFFGKGQLKKGSVGNRQVLIGIIYFLLVPLPIGILAYSTVQGFSVTSVFLLGCLVAISVYSASTWLGKHVAASEKPVVVSSESVKKQNS